MRTLFLLHETDFNKILLCVLVETGEKLQYIAVFNVAQYCENISFMI